MARVLEATDPSQQDTGAFSAGQRLTGGCWANILRFLNNLAISDISQDAFDIPRIYVFKNWRDVPILLDGCIHSPAQNR